MTPGERTVAAIKDIASQHKVSVCAIMGPSRRPKIAAARQHCYWHLHVQRKSCPAIGKIMGRHHTSVMHGVLKHVERNAPLA